MLTQIGLSVRLPCSGHSPGTNLLTGKKRFSIELSKFMHKPSISSGQKAIHLRRNLHCMSSEAATPLETPPPPSPQLKVEVHTSTTVGFCDTDSAFKSVVK